MQLNLTEISIIKIKSSVYGITTLDIVRASTFVSQLKGTNPLETKVNVIGGHSGATIIPLLSQLSGVTFTQDDIAALTKRIQFGGDEVVQAKNGAGSATLSMAYAGARFVNSLLDAIVLKKSGVVECAFVQSDVAKELGVEFFASPVELGPDGVTTIHGYGTLSPYEQTLLTACVSELKGSINKGIDFTKATPSL